MHCKAHAPPAPDVMPVKSAGRTAVLPFQRRLESLADAGLHLARSRSGHAGRGRARHTVNLSTKTAVLAVALSSLLGAYSSPARGEDLTTKTGILTCHVARGFG